jgi:hypothetical protein
LNAPLFRLMLAGRDAAAGAIHRLKGGKPQAKSCDPWNAQRLCFKNLCVLNEHLRSEGLQVQIQPGKMTSEPIILDQS